MVHVAASLVLLAGVGGLRVQVAVDTGGRREPGGAWTVSYAGRAPVVETSTYPAAQVPRLDLAGTGGRPLASVATT